MRHMAPAVSKAGIILVSCAMAVLFAGTMGASAADGLPTQAELEVLGLTVGTTDGFLYGTGPAAVVGTLCVTGIEDGVVCAFTGDNETGEGTIIVTGSVPPEGTCVDVPLPNADNVNNETADDVLVGDGTCASPGPGVQTDKPGTDSNNPTADPRLLFHDCFVRGCD